MMKIAKTSSFFVFLVVSLLSMGCAQWVMNPNISTYGEDINFLFSLVSWIVLPITVVVFFIMLYFMLRFRRSKHEKAEYLPGSSGKPGFKIAKIVLTIDILVFLLDIVILYFTVGAWNQIEGPVVETEPGTWSFPMPMASSPGSLPGQDDFTSNFTSDVVEIQVIGRQFAWDFVYPGADREFLVSPGLDGIRNTLDDVDDNIYQNYAMHIPVDTRIVIHLQAPDVIHSFWVKNLRFKQDALPGRTITKWFEVDSQKLSGVDWNSDIDMDKIRTLENRIRNLRAERIDYRHKETYEKFQSAVKNFNTQWKKSQKDKKTLQTLAQEVKTLQTSLNTLNERIETGLLDKEFEQAQKELRSAHKSAQRGKRLFEIACAELCGNYHYLMNAWLVLHSKEGFQKWLQKQMDPASPITEKPMDQKLAYSLSFVPEPKTLGQIEEISYNEMKHHKEIQNRETQTEDKQKMSSSFEHKKDAIFEPSGFINIEAKRKTISQDKHIQENTQEKAKKNIGVMNTHILNIEEVLTMALQLGDLSPDFTAESTEGTIHFHEWIGDNWAVLFSHPKAFTPVCTTELGEVARIKSEFEKRNVKVIGLSVDPVENSNRWSKDIHETQGVALNFPLIADTDRAIAGLYGMIHPNASDTMTVRSVFIISPDKKIRLTLTYPASAGRNFVEILRILDSLQLTDRHKVATPVNWKSGEDVIIVPAVSDEDARKLFPKGWKAKKPYLRLVEQP